MLAHVVIVALTLAAPPRTDGSGGTATIVDSSPSRAGTKLAAFIAHHQPKAKPYAQMLATRILAEAKRHGMKAHELASVAWIESDFSRWVKGPAGEHGVWQLRPWDHGMQDGLDQLRARAAEFPVLARIPVLPWRMLRRHRITILMDIRASTYLAAMSIQRHVRMCKRLGHRVGHWQCKSAFVNRCPRSHKYEMDRIGHYNSGVSWPKRSYLRKLRRRSRKLKRIIEGR